MFEKLDAMVRRYEDIGREVQEPGVAADPERKSCAAGECGGIMGVEKGGGLMSSTRLTWKEIQEKYPDQWVGLVDVEWEPHNSATIHSAVVKYTGMAKSELTRLMLEGKLISRYTTPDNVFQMGMIGVHG